jgi:hypothetical protein
MFLQYGLTQDEIAKLLKTSKTAVNHNIRAFSAMKDKYLRDYPGPGAVRKFSYFLEVYKKPELRDWVTNDPAALDQFVRWVGTGKIGQGMEVRDLVDIVGNQRALQAFIGGGVDAARRILERDRPELTSPLFKLMVDMTKAIDGARLDDVTKVRGDRLGGAKAIVRELKESVDRFVELCGGLD